MKRLFLIALIGACSSKPSARERALDAAPAPVPVPRPAPDAARPVDAAIGDPIDVLEGFRATVTGKPATGAELERVAALPVAKGCDDDDAMLLHQGDRDVIVSLAHGVVALTGADVTATSEALGDCEGSATDLEGAWMGQVIPDPDPELVIEREHGGKNAGEYVLEIWKLAGDHVDRIFSTSIESYEGTDKKVAHASLAADGTIHVTRGETTEIWALGPDGRFAKR